jgi:nucleotide-binding universal stress UspA family protein
LWAEVFSRVNVLKSALVEEIPALADALKVDLVVLAALDSGFASIRAVRFIEETLMTFLRVPLCIIGRHSDRKPWSENGIRRVLLPVSLPSDVRLRLRFACHLAESHHARLTVLHAFGSRRESVRPWERTPVAVEAQLPISELRRDGILCPIEVTVAEGDPATAIVKFDAIRKHDLIIMGTPGLADPAPRYGNRVVQTVISEAGCPVVVLGRSIDPASAFVGAVTPLSLA